MPHWMQENSRNLFRDEHIWYTQHPRTFGIEFQFPEEWNYSRYPSSTSSSDLPVFRSNLNKCNDDSGKKAKRKLVHRPRNKLIN
jgi:hypothetical protein